MSALTAWYRSEDRVWAPARLGPHPMPNTPDAVVINMGDLHAPNDNDKKKQDTLFGPNIGIITSGPQWTERLEKSSDELTPDIVKGWIEKSKEANHTTTTLQALVNLKRPTLRLTPLHTSPSSSSPDLNDPDSQHHHGLEFEYDCDAPKCGIYVHVILSPSHHLAEKEAGDRDTKLLVFESVTEGGFGKLLKLEEGAMLELGRFDHRTNTNNTKKDPTTITEDPASTSSAPVQVSTSTTSSGDATPVDASTANNSHRHKKRFTAFHFRKHAADRSIAGPALAVVDAESHPPLHPTSSNPPEVGDQPNGVTGDQEKAGEEEEGVKVTIRLVALGEDGRGLDAPNEQTTYLHIVRFGPKPVIRTEGVGEGAATAEGEREEDTRPWVVKVVKREATIGPHTFHLHEIYGLSANSTTATHAIAPTASPTTPTTATTHTYPPLPSSPPIPTLTNALTHHQEDEEPSSECLVCLSSPREVVLLPCRHLVACRECAINMIEFGAGGVIVHSDGGGSEGPAAAAAAPSPPITAPTLTAVAAPQQSGGEDANGQEEHVGDVGEGEGDGGANNTNAAQPEVPTPAPVPVPVPAHVTQHTNPRRKRKAKGWFCPVCRQPYTSLLRITTTPPSKDVSSSSDDEQRESTDLGEHSPSSAISPAVHPLVISSQTASMQALAPAAAVETGVGAAVNGTTTTNGTGRFLRAFSRQRAAGGGTGDVERGGL